MEFERRGDEEYGEKYSRCAEREGIIQEEGLRRWKRKEREGSG